MRENTRVQVQQAGSNPDSQRHIMNRLSVITWRCYATVQHESFSFTYTVSSVWFAPLIEHCRNMNTKPYRDGSAVAQPVCVWVGTRVFRTCFFLFVCLDGEFDDDGDAEAINRVWIFTFVLCDLLCVKKIKKVNSSDYFQFALSFSDWRCPPLWNKRVTQSDLISFTKNVLPWRTI